MLVTFISQCEKKALKRTRRILDAFANRIGDHVWQTAITEAGLKTVYALLKKSATKSTAVSCHRVRTRQRTELIWIVGNRSKFNTTGLVAVNRTKRDLCHQDWENHWKTLYGLRDIAVLAALFHDIGKSTQGFQAKLEKRDFTADPYRHEWISLKLFIWLIEGCHTDTEIFERLANIEHYLSEKAVVKFINSGAIKNLENDIKLNHYPPLAQWIAWLMVTHHRLPPLDMISSDTTYRKIKGDLLAGKTTTGGEIEYSMEDYYENKIQPYPSWMSNPDNKNKLFAKFNNLVICSPLWQQRVKRYAKKASNNLFLQQLIRDLEQIPIPDSMPIKQKKSKNNDIPTSKPLPIADPFLLLLSRLCLMAADHHYSSLAYHSTKRLAINSHFPSLIANTTADGEANQTLEEHLLGVADFAAKFCYQLPLLHKELPKLVQHEPLIKNTHQKDFLWQNKAFDLAYKQHVASEEHGFFAVNMASTGCGKTIANVRIMYALADPKKGARITIALGLRVLTLQTGQSLRKNLQLSEQELAVLVGGQAYQQLFYLTEEQQKKQQNQNSQPNDTQEDSKTAYGSESIEEWIDGFVDGGIDGWASDDLDLGTIVANETAQKLLFSPIVSCTIDHLMQASECSRGGKYITPLLRLFSSDLILDEPDDFDYSDFPALSRLVYLAGVFGSRVLLSSATLPADLIEGLFKCYQAGRMIYNQNFSKATPHIVCAWFDENTCQAKQIEKITDFSAEHQTFIKQRTSFLKQQPVRRMAKILAMPIQYIAEQEKTFYQQMAFTLLESAKGLHDHYHICTSSSEKENKTISIGLIRMANIQPLIQITNALYQQDFLQQYLQNQQEFTHYQFHVCCYHSQQILILRHQLEKRLDQVLQRKNETAEILLQKEDIAHAIQQYPEKTHHIFMVLATPVAEVGRDHDYDWAIIEPSSMRSIIQLAGRVWRHRPNLSIQDQFPNIHLLQYNVKALKKNKTQNNQKKFYNQSKEIVFNQPGFENNHHRLESHDLNQLLTPSQITKIDAIPRIEIRPNLQSENNLVDLELSVIRDLMNNDKDKKCMTIINAYYKKNTSNHSHTFLTDITPFRSNINKHIEYVVFPDEDQRLNVYLLEKIKKEKTYDLSQQGTYNTYLRYKNIIENKNTMVSPWLVSTVADELVRLEKYYPNMSREELAIHFSTVQLREKSSEGKSKSWYFNEYFGCWSGDLD